MNRPDHYPDSEFEPIKLIQKYNLSFEAGNALKYIARCKAKGSELDDLKKALDYCKKFKENRGDVPFIQDFADEYKVSTDLGFAAQSLCKGHIDYAEHVLIQEINKLENQQNNGETTA